MKCMVECVNCRLQLYMELSPQVARCGTYSQPPLILLLLMLLLHFHPMQVLLEEEHGRGGYRPVQVSRAALGHTSHHCLPACLSGPRMGHAWVIPTCS